jgi:hypothetical protein
VRFSQQAFEAEVGDLAERLMVETGILADGVGVGMAQKAAISLTEWALEPVQTDADLSLIEAEMDAPPFAIADRRLAIDRRREQAPRPFL